MKFLFWLGVIALSLFSTVVLCAYAWLVYGVIRDAVAKPESPPELKSSKPFKLRSPHG